MFKSFFPNPKLFFGSFIAWFLSCVFVWIQYGDQLAKNIGFTIEKKSTVLGLGHFISQEYLWFSLYYLITSLIFCTAWSFLNKNKWSKWSVFGTAFIIYSTYFSVQFSVAFNNWIGPFYNLIQKALTKSEKINVSELYNLIFDISGLFVVGVLIFTLTRFFISHYVFRWRTAMNNHYTEHWARLRSVEGASQRVQEDTMKLAKILETLGVSLVDAVMTLIAFLPVLHSLSGNVTTLPLVGEIPYPLVSAAIFWALFGTILLAVVGIKLPGLEFDNQKVEAAFRKELVYGEDNSLRADKQTLKVLYSDVQKNYFKLYFNYMYFNVFKRTYLYLDWIFILVLLAPTVAAGAINFGIFTQIRMSFYHVGNSLQYIADSWGQIVDLMSIYKRLNQFEDALKSNDPMDPTPHPDFINLDTLEVSEEGKKYFKNLAKEESSTKDKKLN